MVFLDVGNRESFNNAPWIEVAASLAAQNVTAKLRIPDMHFLPHVSVFTIVVRVRWMKVAVELIEVPRLGSKILWL